MDFDTSFIQVFNLFFKNLETISVVGKGGIGVDADFYGELASMPISMGHWRRCRFLWGIGVDAEKRKALG